MEKKVALKSVLFQWSESNRIEDKKLVATMKHANQILQHAAAVAPKPEGAGPGCAYHKTSIVLTWEDGETYEARVDLQHEDLKTANILGTHVREFCEFSAGLKKPTMESYDGFIKASAGYAKKTVEQYQADFVAFLAKYDLDEEPTAPAAPIGGWENEEAMYEALGEPIPALKPTVAPAPKEEGFKGAKYDAELDIAEIAKRVRAEIKAAKLPGKIGVRIQRYAGGQSLNVNALVEFPVRHGDVERENRERAQGIPCPWLTREAYDLEERLKAIIEAYNYDRSDIMTDYFNVNFYTHVTLKQVEQAQKEAA